MTPVTSASQRGLTMRCCLNRSGSTPEHDREKRIVEAAVSNEILGGRTGGAWRRDLPRKKQSLASGGCASEAMDISEGRGDWVRDDETFDQTYDRGVVQ